MDITILEFPDELKERVRRAGLFRHVHAYYLIYTLVLALGLALVYVSLLSVETLWHVILAGLAMAFVMGQFGFLGHDITHGQVSDSQTINTILGESIWGLVLGMSMLWWKQDHNQHHQETNRLHHDTQINEQFIFSPTQMKHASAWQKRYLLPVQHWLFIPLSALMYVAIIIFSIHYVTTTLRQKPFRARILIELILMTIHFVGMFSFVLSTLGLWYGLVFLGIVHFIGGLSMGLAFAPNHKGQRILRDDETVNFYTQVVTTRNIQPSLVTDFILGGLGYQIEHHLFPKLPRPLLKKAQPIVKQYCAEHNIPYHETSLWDSYQHIIRSLKHNAQYAKKDSIRS